MMEEKKTENLVRIGDVAREAGVNSSMIRYYTGLGLLTVASRTAGGQRLYRKDETLTRLHTIRALGGKRAKLSELAAQFSRSGEKV